MKLRQTPLDRPVSFYAQHITKTIGVTRKQNLCADSSTEGRPEKELSRSFRSEEPSSFLAVPPNRKTGNIVYQSNVAQSPNGIWRRKNCAENVINF